MDGPNFMLRINSLSKALPVLVRANERLNHLGITVVAALNWFSLFNQKLAPSKFNPGSGASFGLRRR
jgi:hypothetical protein